MIELMVVIALGNGFLVSISRMINARLGKEIGAAGASIWNHFTGAIMMGLFVLLLKQTVVDFHGIPFYAFIGGLIGAGYLTLSNFLIPKIGASKATILMIAGQIGFATIIDYLRHIVINPVIAFLGVAFIITGVSIGEYSKVQAKAE